MKRKIKIFSGKLRDERLSAVLGPIYKTGFYIMVFGILFDVYTRYNYLAQTEAPGNMLAQGHIESLVLIVACVVVGFMTIRRGVYSDSLQYTEARAFGKSGVIIPSIAVTCLISFAAVGGRLYNEVLISGWNGVTWAGDFAMLIIMLAMFGTLILAVQYFTWRSYRNREDRLIEDED